MGKTSRRNQLAERQLEVVDAIDLCDEPTPDRIWVIEGLLERQDRLFLIGAEGAGKSLMALTLAVQAAAGLPVWGKFPMPAKMPASVAYLDLELSRYQIQRRLRPLRTIAKLPRTAVHVISQPDGVKLDLNNANRYVEALRPYEPDIVVIDPFYKLTYADLLKEAEIKPVLYALDAIRVDLNCALVICHHLRKAVNGAERGESQSDMYGSSVLLRWPEFVLSMRNDHLEVQKDRNGNFFSENGERPNWKILRGGSWKMGLTEPLDATEAQVLDVIKVAGSITANQVHQTVGGRRQRTYSIISQLATKGVIAKRDGKHWEEVAGDTVGTVPK